MKSFVVVILVITGVVGGYLVGTRDRSSERPVVFINDRSGVLLERAQDIWQSCPGAAFSLTEKGSDYQLGMYWEKDHWTSLLVREDSVLLMKQDSPDFNHLMREACRAIKPDAATWLPEHRMRIASEPRIADESNRYELRDIHDGQVYGAALLDRRTGKVWTWHAAGEWFKQETVLPEPEVERK